MRKLVAVFLTSKSYCQNSLQKPLLFLPNLCYNISYESLHWSGCRQKLNILNEKGMVESWLKK